jgi:septum formation protein
MLGVPFERVASTYDEPDPTPEDHAAPENYVRTLAQGKSDCAQLRDADGRQFVLGCDTTVWHQGTILNKPRDKAEACAMLKTLCGSSHRVLSGVHLREVGGDSCTAHEETHVHFAPRSDEWIARYVETGEPMDKAGAYAAQGMGALLIEKIEGDFFNVVGLPLFRLSEMLRAQGVEIEGFWEPAST